MKTIIYFALFALPSFCFSQSVTYSIDLIRQDSFYLVVHSASAPTADQPRPQTNVGYTLFRSPAELSKFIENIRAKAEKDEEDAQKQYAQAQQMKAIAGKIEEAAAKSFPDKKQ